MTCHTGIMYKKNKMPNIAGLNQLRDSDTIFWDCSPGE